MKNKVVIIGWNFDRDLWVLRVRLNYKYGYSKIFCYKVLGFYEVIFSMIDEINI